LSVEPLSILILGAVFLIATVGHIHMGALAIAAAFVLGMCVLPGDFDAKVDQIAGGFPGDLFVVLAGITYLFAIAKNNGTVDWLVQAALRSVGGRAVEALPGLDCCRADATPRAPTGRAASLWRRRRSATARSTPARLARRRSRAARAPRTARHRAWRR